MASTTIPNRRSNPLPWILIAVVGLVICVTSLHAWEKRGAVAVQVASSFTEDGHCSQGPSAVMKATNGVRMMVCFTDAKRVQLHIQNSEGGGITDVPADEISRPASYLKSPMVTR